jgi:hypothetical protein
MPRAAVASAPVLGPVCLLGAILEVGAQPADAPPAGARPSPPPAEALARVHA